MKKIFTVFLALLLTVTLVGCATKSEKKVTKQDNNVVTEDNFYDGYIWKSEFDQAGKKDKYGSILKYVSYMKIEKDYVALNGVIGFRQQAHQDTMGVFDNKVYRFKLTDKTKYEGRSGSKVMKTFNKNEFSKELAKHQDEGMGFEIEVKNGVAVKVALVS